MMSYTTQAEIDLFLHCSSKDLKVWRDLQQVLSHSWAVCPGLSGIIIIPPLDLPSLLHIALFILLLSCSKCWFLKSRCGWNFDFGYCFPKKVRNSLTRKKSIFKNEEGSIIKCFKKASLVFCCWLKAIKAQNTLHIITASHQIFYADDNDDYIVTRLNSVLWHPFSAHCGSEYYASAQRLQLMGRNDVLTQSL